MTQTCLQGRKLKFSFFQVLMMLFLCVGASANDSQKRGEFSNNPKLQQGQAVGTPPVQFRTHLEQMAANKRDTGNFGSKSERGYQPPTPEEFLLKSLTTILTDDVRDMIEAGKPIPAEGRDSEKQQIMEVMVRDGTKMAFLVGGSTVGKSTVALMFAHDLVTGNLPQSELFKSELAGAEIIETTAGKISQMALSNEAPAQAAALELFFEAVEKAQQRYESKYKKKKNIIVVIDGIDTMDTPQWESIRGAVEKRNSRLIGIGQNDLIEAKIKEIPGVSNKARFVPVQEFPLEKTKALLRAGPIPRLEEKYNVLVSEKALEAVVRTAPHLEPDTSAIFSIPKILEEIISRTHLSNKGEMSEVTDSIVYDYVQSKLGFPVNPFDRKALDTYIENLRTEIKKRVKNQDQMVDALVNLWRQVLTGDPKKPKVLLLLGPTGTGKSLLIEVFAELAFGNKNRAFQMDGTTMATGGYSGSTYFGNPTGVNKESKSSGTLIDWMRDPSRGKFGGIIAVHEADKALGLNERWMEYLDRGELRSGDGRLNRANHHIVIMTSNQRVQEIFPPSTRVWTQAEIDRRSKEMNEAALRELLLRPDPDHPEKVMAPETLGRVTTIALANPISVEAAPDIGALEVAAFAKRYQENTDIRLEVSKELISHLALTGVDTYDGARPLKNQVESFLDGALTLSNRQWNIARGSTVQLDLIPETPESEAAIQVTYNGQTLKAQAPQRPKQNPLLDPGIRKMLLSLEDKLHEKLGGQPEAIAIAANAIRGKYGDITRGRPVSLLFLGSTGGGKTALGKAIGYAMYSLPEDKVPLISLGDIRSDEKFNDFFGRGGAKVLSPFEKALMDFPTGAPIIFDEVSNMGGDSLTRKESYLKGFYTVLEEGFWVSPQTGRVYDLNKYVFIFTGNDTEKRMEGLESDEQRLEKWRELNNRETLHKELRLYGFSEAILARFDAIAQFRPLVGAVKVEVTSKLLTELKKRFEKQHEGVELLWDAEFEKSLARAFFSHSRGARSVRGILDNQVTPLLTASTLHFDYNPKILNGLKVRLSMTDTLPAQSFATGDVPPRDITIEATFENNGQVIYKGVQSVTEDAPKKYIVTLEQAKAETFRHLGRAALNQERLTQRSFRSLSLRTVYFDGEDSFSHSDYRDIINGPEQTSRKKVESLLISFWGGRLALEMAGFDSDLGWPKDQRQMWDLAYKYFVLFGLGNGEGIIPINDRGEPNPSPRQKEVLQANIEKLFEETKREAELRIQPLWAKIQKAAEETVKNHGITRERLNQILSDDGSGPAPGSCGSALSSN